MRADLKRSFSVRSLHMRGLSLISAVMGMTLLSLLLILAHLTLQPMLSDFGKIPRQLQALVLADTIMSTLTERLFLASCQEMQPIDWAAFTGCYANDEKACAENYQGSLGQFLKADTDHYAPFRASIAVREENLVSSADLPQITSHRIDVTVQQAGAEDIALATYWSGSSCAAVLHQ
ncbi:MAG: hypothetical protein ACRC9T_02055 [Vibrionaceae bacterium]